MTLESKVKELISDKIKRNEPFTNVDISHPLIAQDPTIRHRQVRDIIQQMWSDNEFQNYTATPITVYPSDNQPITARLFHPDDPSFDITTYTKTDQQLDRATPGSNLNTKRRFLQLSDSSDDNVVQVSTSVTGAAVTAQCEVQKTNNTLNIPRVIVNKAGWVSGDAIVVEEKNATITITKTSNHTKQTVDKEGRIRIHGSKLDVIGKSNGQSCTVLLVNDNNETKIQVQ